MFGLFKRNTAPATRVTGKVVRFGTYNEVGHGGYTVLVEGGRPLRLLYPLQPNRPRQYIELTQPGDEVTFLLMPDGTVVDFENKNLEWFDSKSF